jgi:YYY domain-containing protein
MTETTIPETQPEKARPSRIYDLLLVYVLLAAAIFRFSGIYWGDYQFLHPDERFLVWVGTDISPVTSISEYFDTANSSLNPQNRGHNFYVYGTLPMFLTRYIVQWVYGNSGFDQMTNVGRPLSALADMLTVFLVYMAAERLYNRRVAILSAVFAAACVLLIQQSHFFTMDTFMNAFSFLAFYFAVRIVVEKRQEPPLVEDRDPYEIYAMTPSERLAANISAFFHDPFFIFSLGFGVALGMAVASKLNAAPMAFVLPVAMLLHLLRLPPAERPQRSVSILIYLALAGLASLLVFRILQPYAFSGPGFFGLRLSPRWLDNLRTLRSQSSGDVDFPPAMQWARRPVWFSFQNMVLWGLGLPLGLLAWTGFLWVAWRLLTQWKSNRDEWLRHALIWGWTAVYFIWQSLALNPTMRYQLPIYPTLAIFAGWAVVALYDYKRESGSLWPRLAAILVGGLALLATFAYAYGFSRIYVRPITRVAASEWIYQNIPGPISLPIQTDQGVYNQSLPVPYSQTITPDTPYVTSFKPKAAGTLTDIYLPSVLDEQGGHEVRRLSISIQPLPSEGEQPASTVLEDDLTPAEGQTGKSYRLTLDRALSLDPKQTYSLRLELPPTEESPAMALDSDLVLHIQSMEEGPSPSVIEQPLQAPATIIRPGAPYQADFSSQVDGVLNEIYVRDFATPDNAPLSAPLKILFQIANDDSEESSSYLGVYPASSGQGYVLVLETPLPVVKDEAYRLTLEMESKGGVISLHGMGIANEGEWDDGLPLRMDGYDGFGGIFPPGLDFNMYWDDNPEKLERFTRILDQADYVVISSSRQWGSLPRLPERFPLTTLYYRNLLGCPPEQVIEYCYNVAEPGMYQGKLGYDLVKTFTSPPAIDSLSVNDQFAEEAFTVYDHPKVFIFKKRPDYDPQAPRAILGVVDFTKVERIAPMRAPSHPLDLMLPDYRLAEQQAGGTWSDLFDTNALINRFQILSVLAWYLSVALLGVIAYPLLRLAVPGLADRGYPLARIAGMLILSYLVWLAGSARIPFSKTTITAVILCLTLLGAALAYYQRVELVAELRQRSRYFLLVEGLALAFFLAFLLVRWGNPDLWHPWKGGEKPMDFSYFNAVLKSTSFPPYDPWFAGGYLNYYYYGFVLAGVLVKWLGIVPAVAYNLILPTLFSMIAMGAFSVVWNLSWSWGRLKTRVEAWWQSDSVPFFSFIPALAAALGTAVLGNLGTVRMIFQGYQKLAAPDGVIEGANLFQHWYWALLGFIKVVQGANLPYSIGDWYWLPSRAIPALGDIEPITEFPYFTVLYADLHAHLLALPLTILALGLVIAVVLGRARWKNFLGIAAWFLMAGLSIGALRPTNTWDMPTFLLLGVLGLGYALWRYYDSPERNSRGLVLPKDIHPALYLVLAILGLLGLLAGAWFGFKALLSGADRIQEFFHSAILLHPLNIWAYASLALAFIPLGYVLNSHASLPENPGQATSISRPNRALNALRFLFTLGGVILLVALAFLLFQPYANWYALGYTKIDLWNGSHTPINAYLTHWGLFLFLIVSWMFWETRDWMAKTPLSALRKWVPYRDVILALLALFLIVVLGLSLGLHVSIAWLVLSLAAWTGLLLLRPGLPDAKRIVLFMVGSGLVLTLMVEVIVLRGDIGRMNTVFKFYLQVWTLFSISAAAALGWLLTELAEWLPGWRRAWMAVLVFLVFGAALFPLLATLAKVDDRISPRAPHTLDGMAYMPTSTYTDRWGTMDLGQDYDAIRWIQENVTGSPVIVEANLRDLYRWGSRYTIYTGLPGVVGWEWHQQQQRAVTPGVWISNRIQEIEDFYTTTDLAQAAQFLQKYNVRYIILGQQERGKYPGPGLDKFDFANGILWQEVYRQEDTAIYEVIPWAP